MSYDPWVVSSAVSAAVTTIATVVYVVVTRDIARATKQQALISAQLATLTAEQQRIASVEKLSATYYAVYDVWRYTALVHEHATQKKKPSESKAAQDFLRAYTDFMAKHYPVIVALLESSEKTRSGLMYLDSLVDTAKGSDLWFGYDDFVKDWGSIYDFFGALKSKLVDSLEKKA